MIKNLKYQTTLNLMMLVSMSITFIILNRWVVTELQEKSFGRVWQYYVSWNDFGFFRRGLLGTLLTESGANRIFGNEYLFAYVFYSVVLIIIYLIFYRALKKLEHLPSRNLISAAILFSPALFAHFGYSTGSNDIVLFLLFVLALLFKTHLIVFTLLGIAGIFTHELFIFMLPAFALIRYFFSDKIDTVRLKELAFFTICSVLSITGLVIFGTPSIPETEFNSVMEQRMPTAAFQHPLWSGYFEVTSSVDKNLQTTASTLQNFKDNAFHLLVPTVYTLSVAIIILVYTNALNVQKLVLLAALLSPIAAQIVASDYYRWVSMSASLSLTFFLIGVSQRKIVLPQAALIFFVAFSIFSPFGGAMLDRPFPMHQFLMERYAR